MSTGPWTRPPIEPPAASEPVSLRGISHDITESARSFTRDPGLRQSGTRAPRLGPRGSPSQRRRPEPVACALDGASRSLQEGALADFRRELLRASPALRQALH